MMHCCDCNRPITAHGARVRRRCDACWLRHRAERNRANWHAWYARRLAAAANQTKGGHRDERD